MHRLTLPDALPFVMKGEEPVIDSVIGPVRIVPPKPKRKKPAALTPMSQRLLEAEGFLVERVEHRNAFLKHVTHDLWQFADLLAIKRGEILAVQVTSDANHAARRTKIADNPKVGIVREAGIRIEIHSWRKVKGKWQVRREDVS